jgi:hypothetical protein
MQRHGGDFYSEMQYTTVQKLYELNQEQAS